MERELEELSIKTLVDDGYLILHKGGKTVSLNPTRSREIIDWIERSIERSIH